jgi:LacI family transcriptional regulator
MKVTLKDIAKIAGISESSVSRALAGDRRISEGTRRRVQELAEQLSYRPNAVARSLAQNRTQTLGIILCTLGNSFYGEIVRGIEDTAMASAFTVILCASNFSTEKERMQLRVLEEKRVDGILITPTTTRLEHVAAVHQHGIKCVLMDTDDDGGSGLSCVGLDHTKGVEEAVTHLIDQGHRRIGFIGGLLTFPTAAAAHRGYRNALQQARIPYMPSMVKVCPDFGVESAYRSTKELLSQSPSPTAIFSFADTMAVGLFRAAHEAHLRIPEDIAVVGYDNIPSSEFLAPSLTTVDQGEYQLGKTACQLLISEIEQRSQLHQTIMLRPRLIVRQSSVFTLNEIPSVTPQADEQWHVARA